jgi:hypothetical protein
MDPTINGQLLAGWGVLIQSNVAEANQRLARQSDSTQIDNRIMAGIIARMLMTAGDPNQETDFNSAARVPNVVSNPNLVPVGSVKAG